jgi:hypothetical protein
MIVEENTKDEFSAFEASKEMGFAYTIPIIDVRFDKEGKKSLVFPLLELLTGKSININKQPVFVDKNGDVQAFCAAIQLFTSDRLGTIDLVFWRFAVLFPDYEMVLPIFACDGKKSNIYDPDFDNDDAVESLRKWEREAEKEDDD